MHDKLFTNQRALKAANLRQYATDLSLDMESFDACLESAEVTREIQADIALATKIGARGTPNFWIGVRDEKEPTKAKLVRNLRGAKSFGEFKAILDGLLEE